MQAPSDEPIDVLLIEDNPADVRLVQELLRSPQRSHFHTISAPTLSEGLALLATNPVDIILVDLGLPDSQGVDTVRALAKKAPHLPIIVLTISDDEAVGLRVLQEGAQRFLSKDALTLGAPYAGVFTRMIRFVIEQKRTEVALAKSEHQYRQLMDTANVIILRADPALTITYCNDYTLKLLGYSSEEFIGQPVVGTLLPEIESTGRDLAQMARDILDHPDRYKHNRNEVLSKDGRRLMIEWTNAPQYDEDGNYTGVLSTGIDITERTAIEDALQESHEEVQMLNEELRSANEELRIANEKLEHRVQERTAELASMNEELRSKNDELRNGIVERQHAEKAANEHAHRISTLNSVIKAGNAADDVQTALESMLNAALAMLDFDAGLIYLMNEEGKVEYRCGRGIAVRMVEQGLDAPFSHGATGCVYREEPMQLYLKDGDHRAFQELAAGAVIPLIAKEQAIGHYAVFSYAKHHFLPEEKDLLEIIGREAGTVIARLQAEEELQRYSDHLEDLVEERTAQLKNAERLAGIGETAAMIGHDLRNPLQGLQYIVDLQKLRFEHMAARKRDTKDWQQQQALFDRISEQIFYMDKIVGDLQDYARPIKIDRETIGVDPLIDDVLVAIPYTDGVQVSVEVGTVSINADPFLIRRVFSNLILNALQAMPRGGTLSITATSSDGFVTIHVRDTGVGIPVEMRDKIFSPLTTGKAKGTGLGLAVVKRVVEAHGGAIEFESEEGKGTTFAMTLPTTPLP